MTSSSTPPSPGLYLLLFLDEILQSNSPVAHDFFACVDDCRFIDTRLVIPVLSVVPQSSDVVRLFKAHRFKPLVQAALDGRQPAGPSPNDRHPFGGNCHYKNTTF